MEKTAKSDQFLEGVAVKFYRGIGGDVQYISGFSKINFFIGPNNSGKSIILNLIANRLASFAAGKTRKLEPTENYVGHETGQFFLAVAVPKNKIIEVILERASTIFPPYQINSLESDLQLIVEKCSFRDYIWINKDGLSCTLYPETIFDESSSWSANWQQVFTMLSGRRGGTLKDDWIPELVQKISDAANIKFPKINLIPAKRRLGERGEDFDDLSGKGLIDILATFQNPSFDKQADRDKFRKINTFLQEITGNDNAQLEVPSEREHLLVHMDNKVLPLFALGTGIHEVILIASLCTIFDHSIMCIEEPEIHLHPLLQRRLINYLIKNTNNQYFIATHSAVFIDTPSSSIYRVHNNGTQTYIESVITKNHQRYILDDLGCHASDILQSNAVVWVEGPSDRIYLKHWLRHVDERLKEGVHYTIMFYGGGLISHLTASDEALDEFIKLRDLNRNMAIIIDSDKESSTCALKPNAERLHRDMGRDGGVSWITAGREIENYVEGTLIQDALKELHPRIYEKPGNTGQFDHAFYFFRKDPKNLGGALVEYKNGDKVGVANKICNNPPNFDVLDLRDRVKDIATMIAKANGI